MSRGPARQPTGAGPEQNGDSRLLHRWVEELMHRSPLDELSERPLSELVHQLRLLLELVRDAGGLEDAGAPRVEPRVMAAADGDEGLERALERAFSWHDRFGHPFSLLLFAVAAGSESPPVGPGTFAEARAAAAQRAYAEALTSNARAVDTVFGAGPGTLAVILPVADSEAAREAGRRLASGLAERLARSRQGGPVRWAGASCPEDAYDATGLVETARARLIAAGMVAGDGVDSGMERASA